MPFFNFFTILRRAGAGFLRLPSATIIQAEPEPDLRRHTLPDFGKHVWIYFHPTFLFYCSCFQENYSALVLPRSSTSRLFAQFANNAIQSIKVREINEQLATVSRVELDGNLGSQCVR